ncbi:betaine operon transcriptional regulator [Halalkalibacter wakoensis JCM 9140]|uniref:HTH-type transcriptional regulator n=1 Tax=Halalkalibacter wakoensis JCM 9140 TaxID=1236970 RepID=W4Q4V4_9BACI|nr:transcriptional regulator [Halalkalibacter wakoensis]GAE26965.1 betaine operon transcriptional regulator [Halalkalibacter wakoensis JCM 9140]
MNQVDEKAKLMITKAKDLVIDSIAETMDLYGVTRSVGIIYGTMYFENNMTLDEMREEIGMSKPSMSTGVKKLQEYDIVKKTYQRGNRKHTYVAEKDFFQFFNKFFTKKWEREININLEAIDQAQKVLNDIIHSEVANESNQEEAKEIIDLLEQSKSYYYWLLSLVEGIRSGEIFQTFPITDKKLRK